MKLPNERLEPTTLRLKVLCSTNWANRVCKLPALKCFWNDNFASCAPFNWVKNYTYLYKKSIFHIYIYNYPRQGIELRTPAWQAGILTTILPRMNISINHKKVKHTMAMLNVDEQKLLIKNLFFKFFYYFF